HLATADEADVSGDRAQLARFADVLSAIPTPPRWIHAAASAGVAALGPVPGCNAIRPGVSLYGLHTAPHLAAALALRPALEWRSRVRRVAAVPKGTGVSYGLEYRLPQGGRVATVPVGYGDGLPRALGRRGRVLLGGPAAADEDGPLTFPQRQRDQPREHGPRRERGAARVRHERLAAVKVAPRGGHLRSHASDAWPRRPAGRPVPAGPHDTAGRERRNAGPLLDLRLRREKAHPHHGDTAGGHRSREVVGAERRSGRRRSARSECVVVREQGLPDGPQALRFGVVARRRLRSAHQHPAR